MGLGGPLLVSAQVQSMRLGLTEHKPCLLKTDVDRVGVVAVGGSATQSEEGRVPQAPGQLEWNMGLGVRKTQAHILHFRFPGCVAMSSSCNVSVPQLPICNMGMLASTSQGCCERQTSPSTHGVVMDQLHEE